MEGPYTPASLTLHFTSEGDDEAQKGRSPNEVAQQINGKAWIRAHPFTFYNLSLRDRTSVAVGEPYPTWPREFVIGKGRPAGWRRPF